MVHNVQLEHDTALLAALGATIVVRLDDRKLATIPATESPRDSPRALLVSPFGKLPARPGRFGYCIPCNPWHQSFVPWLDPGKDEKLFNIPFIDPRLRCVPLGG